MKRKIVIIGLIGTMIFSMVACGRTTERDNTSANTTKSSSNKKTSMKKYILNIEVYPMFEKIFFVSMITILIVFPVICAIGLIQLIGFFFAIKDEADLELVFYSNGTMAERERSNLRQDGYSHYRRHYIWRQKKEQRTSNMF